MIVPAPSAKVPEARGGAKPTIWRWFLLFEAVVALVYFPFGFPSGKPRILGVVPWMEWAGQVPAWSVLGLSAVAAIAYGAYRYRPRAPLAWWFIGAGVLLFITGDTIYKSWHQLIGQQSIPFPSFVDAIYITMYPVLAIGLLLITRSRVHGSDRASLLDALDHHAGCRAALVDLPHRPQRACVRRPSCPPDGSCLPPRRHLGARDVGAPLERRWSPQHRRTPARHRDGRDARRRLRLRSRRAPRGLELAGRQPLRLGLDPLLQLLGRGSVAPFDAGTVRAATCNDAADERVPVGPAGDRVPHRPGGAPRRNQVWQTRRRTGHCRRGGRHVHARGPEDVRPRARPPGSRGEGAGAPPARPASWWQPRAAAASTTQRSRR